MKNFLTEELQSRLKLRHRTEKNGRVKDRIKAIILSDMGWTYLKIAEALLIDDETVSFF
jgi:hypothetical protein